MDGECRVRGIGALNEVEEPGFAPDDAEFACNYESLLVGRNWGAGIRCCADALE